MRVSIITPPQPVVTVEEALLHLRRDSGPEDVLIETFIAAATGSIDGPTGWLGRFIGEQTVEVYYPLLAVGGEMLLPYPPTISVEEVAGRQSDGQWLAFDPAAYELQGDTVVLSSYVNYPPVQYARDGFRVRYRAGYEDVPGPIRVAILLMVADLYRNRSTVSIGTPASAVPMSTTVEMLLGPFRVFR